jgi:hypothetical protein
VSDLYAATARWLVVTVSDRVYTTNEHCSDQRPGIEEDHTLQDVGVPA